MRITVTHIKEWDISARRCKTSQRFCRFSDNNISFDYLLPAGKSSDNYAVSTMLDLVAKNEGVRLYADIQIEEWALHNMFRNLYIDYVNNFLTVSTFAEWYNMSDITARKIIDFFQK